MGSPKLVPNSYYRGRILLARFRARFDSSAGLTSFGLVNLLGIFKKNTPVDASIQLVNRSVEWWENRTLHQQSTLAELKIQDLTLFTLMLGFVVFGLVAAWLLLHRFRVGWLEQAVAEHGVAVAIAERHLLVEIADLVWLHQPKLIQRLDELFQINSHASTTVED